MAASTSSDPSALDRIQLGRQLLEEIERLSADDRTVLVLAFWEGLSSAECAARLGRPASTVRTQLQRALAKLRRRLDEHRGGRAAWMAALLPFAGSGRRAGTKALAIASLVGAVAFGAVAVAPNGCGSELATAPAQLHETRSYRRAPPPAIGAVIDRHEEARSDVRAGAVRAGVPLPVEKPAHPKLAYHHAFLEIVGPLAECREGSGPGRVRAMPVVIFAPEHEPIVESVEFARADNLSAAEEECIRQTILAMDIAQPELEAEGFWFTPTEELTFDAAGALSHRAVNMRPPLWLFTERKLGEDLRGAVAACDPNALEDATVVVRLRWDPASGELADAEALGVHAASVVGACAVAAIRDIVRPVPAFEPTRAEHSLIDCTFALGVPGMYACERVPEREGK